MRCYSYVALMLIICLCSLGHFSAKAQAWTKLGDTNIPGEPYTRYAYKLLEEKSGEAVASVIELAMVGDVNFYYRQATYQIKVNKWVNTVGRFDGLEIKCISGNATAATFYIYNNALWVLPTYQWGYIMYRHIQSFNANPMTVPPHGQTTTYPTNALVTTSDYGIKCDFDVNKFYKLSYEDTTGNTVIGERLGVGTVPNYNLHTVANDNKDRASALIWGEYYGAAISTLDTTGKYYAFAVLGNSLSTGASAPGWGKPHLYVLTNGNIGMGTSTPQSKLSVNGDITARRLRVTQSGWPDYVFHDNYSLPSLDSVENYIKTNRHLPGIPAADDVHKNGLDVGETNKQLLQKIEELTLYIIEQNKRIAQLEAKRK